MSKNPVVMSAVSIKIDHVSVGHKNGSLTSEFMIVLIKTLTIASKCKIMLHRL